MTEQPGPSESDITIRFAVVENSPGGDICRWRLQLVNRGKESFPGDGWKLYFNFAQPVVPESVPDFVRITHVNGDFYRLVPAPGFGSLPAGASRSIELEAKGAVINESSAPSGFYFVFSEGGRELPPQRVSQAEIEPFLRPEQTRRSSGDQVEVANPQARFQKNRDLSLLPSSRFSKIIPTPVSVKAGRGTVALDAAFRIHFAPELAPEAEYLAAALEPLLGARLPCLKAALSGPRIIRLRTGVVRVGGRERRAGEEAYRLSVSAGQGIELLGTDRAGVFYAAQSLRALVSPEAYVAAQKSIALEEVVVEDAPHFAYRGMHLDVARNFKSKEAVKKLLDLMAFYKLNRFHFHLSDDEGWRLAIEELPELTEVGGRRGHTVDESEWLIPSLGSGPDPDPQISCGSGHYTREDFVEILQHAWERHIEVIPEIDLPGHARAAIKAMDARYSRLLAQGRGKEAGRFLLRDLEDRSQYRSVQGWNDNVINVCQESTYDFLETVVDDIIEMYGQAGVPLRTLHTGGDEVPGGAWERSPACRNLVESGHAGVSTVRDLSDYFLQRFARLLAERRLITAGWEEIAREKIEKSNAMVYVWNSVWGLGGEENAYKLANAGYRVILCNASNLYFDLPYEKDPKEPGYYWAGFVDTRQAWEFNPYDLYQSGSEDLMGRPLAPAAYRGKVQLTEAGRRNILGMQGQLWGENSKGREWMEYQAFPKLLGLAERAWAEPSWGAMREPERRRQREVAWNRFANALGQRELPRLDYLYGGVNFRIPPPGAVIEKGQLRANVAFPGLVIRFTTDGSEPNVHSPLYEHPVAVGGLVKLRAFSRRGRGSRVSHLAVSGPSYGSLKSSGVRPFW